MMAVAASRRRAIAIILFAALLGGCVGSPGGSPLATSEFSDDTGLGGRVVSDEIFPVVGAAVSVEDGPATTTDDEGRFELVGLAPGQVTVRVEAAGYHSLNQEVEVTAGTIQDVTFVLEGIPGQAPYVSTLIFTGFIGCGWSIIFGAGWYSFTPCPFGANRDRFKVEVGPDWRAGIHEMTWKTSEEMLLASSLVPTCANRGAAGVDRCPAIVAGKSPLKIVARPEDAVYAKKYSIDGKAAWPTGNYSSFLLTAYAGHYRTEINQTFYNQCRTVNGLVGSPPEWGCPFGVGVTTNLRSELYHTTFYRQEPPNLADYSAIPDQ